MKKRILICNDAHYLMTGYGKYGRQVLNRLADTNKFELAELACYGEIGDERDQQARWLYYPNAVPKDDPRYSDYTSNIKNEFGQWRFERVCLDFKPDIVWDIRDFWMLSHERTSPLRDFYHWVIMPTVDSAPQKEHWIETFMNADGVFTYSDWGLDILRQQSRNHINTIRSAPPGVDLEIYTPVKDKPEHKQSLGFFKDSNVVGTIMRNQSRKLYPDLMITFRKFLDNCHANQQYELAKRSYLYIHTSYPDVGWDIPGLIKEHGLGHKVVFTYICRNCDRPFCAFFQDAKTVCPFCNHAAAVLPNVGTGLSPEHLAQVLNIFDVYIQYAVCEGFGMPQVEAAACGVPLMSVNYSAMKDVVKKTKGWPIPVQRMYRDIGTQSYRALPDNDECAKMIHDVLSQPKSILRRRGFQARKATENHYDWDKTAKIWEEYFDAVELTGLQGKWDAPSRKARVPSMLSQEQSSSITNSQFMDWAIKDVMAEPKYIGSRFAMQHLRNLNYGSHGVGKNVVPVTRQSIYDELSKYATQKNMCEDVRIGKLELENQDYIEYAHEKMRLLNQ